jgi:hypothetical protein
LGKKELAMKLVERYATKSDLVTVDPGVECSQTSFAGKPHLQSNHARDFTRFVFKWERDPYLAIAVAQESCLRIYLVFS